MPFGVLIKVRFLSTIFHNPTPSHLDSSLSLSLSLCVCVCLCVSLPVRQELANPQEAAELEEANNQGVVLALYEALSSRDVDTVHKLLAPDLEWWFHGPPTHQFMMRLLTGIATSSKHCFHFDPLSITAFGSTVLVEGCDYTRSISWVHAWTVTDGIITQVREYFNTSLTVTKLKTTGKSSPSDIGSSHITALHCPSVWESTFSNRAGKSVPGLVLAI